MTDHQGEIIRGPWEELVLKVNAVVSADFKRMSKDNSVAVFQDNPGVRTGDIASVRATLILEGFAVIGEDVDP